MKKYGKIPPHFIYFIENEGIQITDIKSSNMILKDCYDRMTIKFPFCNRTLDIQIIFDYINSSNPPDFIILNEDNIEINYIEIIKDWNFKDSSTLYISLNKLKYSYCCFQEKRLKHEIEKNYNSLINTGNHHNENDINDVIFNIWKYIEKVFSGIKSKLNRMKKTNDITMFSKIYNNNVNSFNSSNSILNNSYVAIANKQNNSKNSNQSNSNYLINKSNIKKNSENLNQTSNDINNFYKANNFIKDEEFNINEIPICGDHKNLKTSQDNNLIQTNNNKIKSIISNSLNEAPSNNFNSFNTKNDISSQEILPEIYFSYNILNQRIPDISLFDLSECKYYISIAYPLDIEIRSRNIQQFPNIVITIYINYEMKFKLKHIIPDFININSFKNFRENDYYELKNLENVLESYEHCIYDYFRDMNIRELIIGKIIDLNLGITLEIDTCGFRKFSQNLYCNEIFNNNKLLKNNNKLNNLRNNNIIQTKNTQNNLTNQRTFFNFVVCYNFDKEDAKILSVNIIDYDNLSNIAHRKFSFNNNDFDNLINNVFVFLISNINSLTSEWV